MWFVLTAAASAADPLPRPLLLPAAPAVAVGAEVPVAYVDETMTCILPSPGRAVSGAGHGQVAVDLGVLAHAQAAWAAQSGSLVVATEEGPPCAGLAPIHALDIPPEGTLVGLRHPPTRRDQRGVIVSQLGDDQTWWVVELEPCEAETCPAAVAFHHDGAPPTLFEGRPGDGPPPAVVALPQGGATVLDLGAEPAVVRLTGDAARVAILGATVLILAAEEGVATGFTRAGDGVPRGLRVEVGGGWSLARAEAEVGVRVDKKVQIKLDEATEQHWIGDPSVARAELSGRVVRIEGKREGKTHLVLQSDSGAIQLVRVSVVLP